MTNANAIALIKEVSGKVEVMAINGAVRQLQVGDKVFAGEQIVVATESSAVLETNSGEIIELGFETKLALHANAIEFMAIKGQTLEETKEINFADLVKVSTQSVLDTFNEYNAPIPKIDKEAHVESIGLTQGWGLDGDRTTPDNGFGTTVIGGKDTGQQTESLITETEGQLIDRQNLDRTTPESGFVTTAAAPVIDRPLTQSFPPLLTNTEEDRHTIKEGDPAVGNVLANDDRIHQTVESFKVGGKEYKPGTTAELPGIGSIVINKDGGYTFTPEPDYDGKVPVITYKTNTGAEDKLIINITPDNIDKTIDIEKTKEDTPLEANVLDNDENGNGALTQFTIGINTYRAFDPDNKDGITAEQATIKITEGDIEIGTILMRVDGSFVFTPAENYNGKVPTIIYETEKGDPEKLEIVVTPVVDPAPEIIIKDENGDPIPDHGGLSVKEATAGVVKGSITISAEAFIDTITIGGVTVDANSVGKTIQGTEGDLTITGYQVDAATGDVTIKYEYKEDGNAENHAEIVDGKIVPVEDNFVVKVVDKDGTPSESTLEFNIVDDVPTAVDDERVITFAADGTAQAVVGNILTGTTNGDQTDVFGADGPVAAVEWDTITFTDSTGIVHSAVYDSVNNNYSLQGEYGTLIIEKNGAYSYTLDDPSNADNANDEVFDYSIKDSDGDIASAKLMIEGKPVINMPEPDPDPKPDPTPDPTTGFSQAENTVYEKGLRVGSDPADKTETVAGSFTVTGGLNTDALSSVLVSGSAFNLLTYDFATKPDITVDGTYGQLTISDYSVDANGVGTVEYTYTINTNKTHAAPTNPLSSDNNLLLDDGIVVSVETTDGDITTSTLEFNIVDDVPTAVADEAKIADGDKAVSGNVITDKDASGNSDNFGADGKHETLGKVVKVSSVAGGDLVPDGVTEVIGKYGKLVMDANGEYTYTLNTDVNGVPVAHPEDEVFNYTIIDRDGDTSTVSLTIDGRVSVTPPLPPEPDPGPAPETGFSLEPNTVYEKGLQDNGGSNLDKTEKVAGSFMLHGGSNTDAIEKIEIIGPNGPVVIGTFSNGVVTVVNSNVISKYGLLTVSSITGDPQGSVTVNYTYEITVASQDHISGLDNNVLLDNSLSIKATTIDGDFNDPATAPLAFNIVDDVPKAQSDYRTIGEDDVSIKGNVITGLVNDVDSGDTADFISADDVFVTSVIASGIESDVSKFTSLSVNKIEIRGDYGSLWIQNDGSYEYILDDRAQALNLGDIAKDVFQYSLKDYDGDHSTTTLTFQVDGANDSHHLYLLEDQSYILKTDSFIGLIQGGSIIYNTIPGKTGAVEFAEPVVVGDYKDKQYVWKELADGDSISEADIANGLVRYAPAADAPVGSDTGANIGDFKYTIVGNGSSATTMQVSVTAVADKAIVTILDVNNSGDNSPGAENVPVGLGLTTYYFTGLDTDTITPNVDGPKGFDGSALKEALTQKTALASSTSSQSDLSTPVDFTDPGQAFMAEGLIYLEAGKKYVFTGDRDDTMHFEIGGDVLFTHGHNDWGLYSSDPFTPPVSGYYDFGIYVYNGSNKGGFDMEVSVDGGTAMSFTDAGLNTYADISEVDAANGYHGEYAIHEADGGLYPKMDVSGKAGALLELNKIDIKLKDTDGSETLTIEIDGLPEGFVLSDGSNSFTSQGLNHSVDVTGWDLQMLTMLSPVYYRGGVDLSITSTTVEQSNNDMQIVDNTIRVNIFGDRPVLLVSDAQVLEPKQNQMTLTGNIVTKAELNDENELTGKHHASIDIWEFDHNGGALDVHVDLGANQFGRLALFKVEADGSLSANTYVANSEGVGGISLSKSDLEAGKYVIAMSDWTLSEAKIRATESPNSTVTAEYPKDGANLYDGQSMAIDYTMTIKGDLTVPPIPLDWNNRQPGDQAYLNNASGTAFMGELIKNDNVSTTLTFIVSLDAPFTGDSETLTMEYRLVGLTAEAGLDYVDLPNGTLTFIKGELFKKVTVTINSDLLNNELDEQFALELFNFGGNVPFDLDPNGHKTTDGLQGIGTILEVSHDKQLEKGGVTVKGSAANSSLFGTENADLLEGGSGSELIDAGSGNDFIFGGAGDDVLFGGAGDDVIAGGAGKDAFIWELGDQGIVGSPAIDTIKDFSLAEGDVLNLSNLLLNESIATISQFLKLESDGAGGTIVIVDHDGGAGPNTESLQIKLQGVDLTGSDLATLIADGTLIVDDIISGTTGADTLSGLAGNDAITGGQGNDTMTGGEGSDTFIWGPSDQGAVNSPAVDTIKDFSTAEGDALDLSALLVNETKANISEYLSVVSDGAGGTLVKVDHDGGATPNSESLQIRLEGIDLSGSNLTALLDDGTIIID